MNVDKIAGLCLLLLVGCAPATSVRPDVVVTTVPMSGGEGTTTIAAFDHLDWPFAMSRLLVEVDGVPVFNDERLPNDRDVLAVLELEPGAHTLQIVMRTSYASTPLSSGDCVVEMRRAHGFHVGNMPARVELDAHLDGVVQGFFERVDLDVKMHGAHVIEGPPTDGSAAMSYIRERVRQARMRKDPQALSCYEPILAEASALNRLREMSVAVDPIDAKLKALYLDALSCAAPSNGRSLDGELASCTKDNGRPNIDRPSFQR